MFPRSALRRPINWHDYHDPLCLYVEVVFCSLDPENSIDHRPYFFCLLAFKFQHDQALWSFGSKWQRIAELGRSRRISYSGADEEWDACP